jgi:hypothetical protein
VRVKRLIELAKAAGYIVTERSSCIVGEDPVTDIRHRVRGRPAITIWPDHSCSRADVRLDFVRSCTVTEAARILKLEG